MSDVSLLNPNYSGYPEPTPIRHLRNALIELKKTLKSSQEREELALKMEHFLNASRRVIWPHQTSAVFHKDAAEKSVQKVVTEFQRYWSDLGRGQPGKSYQDLLDALLLVETGLGQLKETF